MSTVTAREAAEVAAANASGRQPVVLVHGLWLLAGSWDAWRERFEEEGYAVVAVDWPDDPADRAAAHADPSVFAKKSVGQVADHVSEVVAGLDRTPILVGHSFGGAARADRRGPRPGARHRRHRPGPEPRGPAPAVLGTQGVLPGAGQPRQPQARGDADLRPVPLRLRQRRVGAGGPRPLRHVPRAGSGAAALPGGDRQPPAGDRGEGREAPRRRAARCSSSPARRTTSCPWRLANAAYKKQKANAAAIRPRSSRSPASATRWSSTATGPRSPTRLADDFLARAERVPLTAPASRPVP